MNACIASVSPGNVNSYSTSAKVPRLSDCVVSNSYVFLIYQIYLLPENAGIFERLSNDIYVLELERFSLNLYQGQN